MNSIAVTVRSPEGQEYRIFKKISRIPWGITNIRMVNKDKSHLDEFLKADAYSEQLNINIAPLAPFGYGLIVVDMQKDYILSLQTLGTIGQICLPTTSVKAMKGIDDKIADVRFKEFLESGRVKEAVVFMGRSMKQVKINLSSNTSLGNMSKIINQYKYIMPFEVDMSPYTVIRYQTNSINQVRMMKEKILKLGFKLDTDEEKLWNTCINDDKLVLAERAEVYV